MESNQVINYKECVRKLNSTLVNMSKWYVFELTTYFSTEEEVILIDLLNSGDGNRHRVYHNILDEDVTTNAELLQRIRENLMYTYDDFSEAVKSVHERL